MLPWPVELAGHSFPSTGLGSWCVALRSSEGSGAIWWPRLDPDTWKGLLKGKPGPAAVPTRAGKGPCASAPSRDSFAPLRAPAEANRPFREKWTLSGTRGRLPPPPPPSRLWLAPPTKLSAAVGRPQGLVLAGNSRKKRVGSPSEKGADGGPEDGGASEWEGCTSHGSVCQSLAQAETLSNRSRYRKPCPSPSLAATLPGRPGFAPRRGRARAGHPGNRSTPTAAQPRHKLSPRGTDP